MKINYCLPIIKTRKIDVLRMITQHTNEYQYFEIWLDTIEGIDNIFVKELVNLLQDKLILLFHRGKLKKPGINNEKKLQIIDLLHNTKAYLDLDISEEKELAYIQKKKIQVKKIVSYHNYQETPANLVEIIKQIDKLNPNIYKIATMCTNEIDALKLLLLQQNLRLQNKQHIILGMGKFGTITRVYGTLWGNKIIYAPIETKDSSAPGQLTKQELEKILPILITKK
ncbi:MAG TPA: type I 3-dehydroquinate dehydratase [Candidatus Sulfotelmatobacter sp.]|jgi:3-dehydroquinate dehydratase type I|nr:type I 3-dehydroquinate dehydratase [Candidatus Sulfotelmatobacter sp.]